MAILGFADKQTELIFRRRFSRRLPQDIQATALRKLIYMDKAKNINDLRVPPSNHLEQLHGNREGQFSIRINEQFRICFSVRVNGFDKVEITDYH